MHFLRFWPKKDIWAAILSTLVESVIVEKWACQILHLGALLVVKKTSPPKYGGLVCK